MIHPSQQVTREPTSVINRKQVIRNQKGDNPITVPHQGSGLGDNQVMLMPSGVLCMTIYNFTVVDRAAHAHFMYIAGG